MSGDLLPGQFRSVATFFVLCYFYGLGARSFGPGIGRVSPYSSKLKVENQTLLPRQ